ncbi:MAG: hypothetical protein V1844_09935 [Pseudomonadota bacterium]
MAVVITIPNHLKFMFATKKVDMENDAFKIILMNAAFAFDKDTHATLADVTSNQIATANGYTQNNKALAGVSVVENDTLDKCTCIWSDVTWTAAGGNIGPVGAAIIYDDSTADDTVVCCIDFGEDLTTLDGFSFIIQAPEIDIA